MSVEGQQDLFATQSIPPYSEPTTSRDAAIAILQGSAAQRQRVYSFIEKTAEYGATAEEIAHALNLDSNSATPRIWELCGNNNYPVLIVKTERRRKTRSGRGARVYVTAKVYETLDPGAEQNAAEED